MKLILTIQITDHRRSRCASGRNLGVTPLRLGPPLPRAAWSGVTPQPCQLPPGTCLISSCFIRHQPAARLTPAGPPPPLGTAVRASSIGDHPPPGPRVIHRGRNRGGWTGYWNATSNLCTVLKLSPSRRSAPSYHGVSLGNRFFFHSVQRHRQADHPPVLIRSTTRADYHFGACRWALGYRAALVPCSPVPATHPWSGKFTTAPWASPARPLQPPRRRPTRVTVRHPLPASTPAFTPGRRR